MAKLDGRVEKLEKIHGMRSEPRFHVLHDSGSRTNDEMLAAYGRTCIAENDIVILVRYRSTGQECRNG